MGGITDAITGNGAKKAASAQAEAAQAGIAATQAATAQSVEVQREALKQQREMFDKALELGEPYRAAGADALHEYTDLLNGSPEAQMAALEKTPGYQFQMEQGTQALERGAAARSGTLSGAQSKALTRYGQGLASTSYNSFMDRLSNLGTLGANSAAGAGTLTASAGQANAGVLQGIAGTYMNQGNNIAQLESQKGAGMASGYLANQASGTSMLNTGMTAAAMFFSDKRTKENIRKVGKEKGHNIYRFNYKGGKKKYEGVLAQEVEKKRPDAVAHVGVLKAVNYGKLGLEMRAV
ncbi:tail fiber domain-containing protein [Candidatus Parcubacteria bacterium]|nr:tail fiber domain-containing protein [Candidatus Parcubacteria bacterium]